MLLAVAAAGSRALPPRLPPTRPHPPATAPRRSRPVRVSFGVLVQLDQASGGEPHRPVPCSSISRTSTSWRRRQRCGQAAAAQAGRRVAPARATADNRYFPQQACCRPTGARSWRFGCRHEPSTRPAWARGCGTHSSRAGVRSATSRSRRSTDQARPGRDKLPDDDAIGLDVVSLKLCVEPEHASTCYVALVRGIAAVAVVPGVPVAGWLQAMAVGRIGGYR